MSDEIQKQATEGITFRIPSGSISQLREDSKKKQLSLNTLVNQILKDYLDWHRYAGQARMFHVPRATFSRLVDNLTEEELSKFAITIAKKDFVDIGLLLRGEFTLPSFLNILEPGRECLLFLINTKQITTYTILLFNMTWEGTSHF